MRAATSSRSATATTWVAPIGCASSWQPPRTPTPPPVKHRFLPGIPGGNCGVWRSVAVALGWDERFVFGSSDIEFGWRAQLAGYRIEYAPLAVVRVRAPAELRVVARQWYRYGVSDASLYREFRRAGMRRSNTWQALRAWAWASVHAL